MNLIAFDIETYADETKIKYLPEVVASKTLKDPSKIKADVLLKKQSQIDKMALNPLYSKIACIGYYSEGIKTVDLCSEKKMIEQFLKLADENIMLSWNGKGFDYEFIVKRGVQLGICALSKLNSYVSRYNSQNHIDLMYEWCGYGKYEKLDNVAQVLLNGNKKDKFDVHDIPVLIKTKSGKELIKRYCLQDCKLVFELAKKMGYLEDE